MNSKVVFITGASRGIGHAIAKRLLLDGYKVGLGYNLNCDKVKALSKKYSNGFSIKIDVSNRDSIRNAIKTFKEKCGFSINILINNAGISDENNFLNISDKDFNRMLNVNLRGPFILCQEIIPTMLDNNWGRIVNISSIGGQWGGKNQVHYAAAKAGLINLTRSLSNLYSNYGITSNAIAIGLIETDMSRSEIKSEKGIKKIKNIPIGRIGNLDEISSTVKFLISEDASYITGQTINLNGGMYYG